MKKSEKRYYRFDVQRNYQFETHDEKGNKVSDITESEWRNKVMSETRILVGDCSSEIFCIFHDCDINDDGTSKGLHFHAVVTFKNNKTQTSAVKLLGASSIHNCQPCQSYVDSLRYLIHVSETALNEMKYIYSVNDVFGWRVSDDGSIVNITVTDFKYGMSRKNDKKSRKEKKKVKDSCIIDIISGNSIVSDIRDVYLQDSRGVGLSAVDYLSDMSLYDRASSEWLRMITEFYQTHYCPLTSIYIFGGGGVGKTTLANALARKFADSHGIHQVAVAGKKTTFDFVGNYKGERVSVFNEFSTSFPVEQFLSVFDPLNASPVNSRNSDKFYFANYAIFTTSMQIEHFIYQLWIPYAKQNSFIPIRIREKITCERDWYFEYMKYAPPGDDKILQIRRRFPVLVTIDSGIATVWLLDIKCNSPESFRFCTPPQNKEPYTKLRSVLYDVKSPDIDKQQEALVDCICRGIDFYYKMNCLKHPDSFEKPDFEKLLRG